MGSGKFDVIVAGAGLVGAYAALALARAGCRVALVDEAGGTARAAPPGADDWDARVYAISPASVNALHASGVWPRIETDRIALCTRMEIFGDEPGARLVFRAFDTGVPALAYMVESRSIAGALDQAIDEQAAITRLERARVQEIGRSGATMEVALDGGAHLTAALVVGADGRNSHVRTLSGLTVDTDDYDEVGVVANFSTGLPHKGCAFQWFRGDSVLAVLPLPGQRISIVWSTRRAHGEALMASAPEVLAADIAAAAEDRLGALTCITPAQAFPLARIKASRLIAEGVALVGDAAHVVHPLAGQGVNLGFGDVAELAQIITSREPYRSIGDNRLLRRYERARAEPVAAMRTLTHGLHWLFGLQGRMPKRLRNAGLNLTHRMPVVRSLLARRAIG